MKSCLWCHEVYFSASSYTCRKAPSLIARAKINNVFWSYISFTKNGALAPGARYVNPIENALTPSGRSERARKGTVGAAAWRGWGPARAGPGPGLARGPGMCPFIFVYCCAYLCIEIFSQSNFFGTSIRPGSIND